MFIFITYDIFISKHAFSITILQNDMCKCAKSFSFWGTKSPRLPTGALPLDPLPLGDFRPPNLLIGQCLL